MQALTRKDKTSFPFIKLAVTLDKTQKNELFFAGSFKKLSLSLENMTLFFALFIFEKIFVKNIWSKITDMPNQ